ncbi:hypothetical protein [Metamycoplasma equirhinis]|uniref:hypothetical protein n=1 Tax=Metamycoplasma equirhinis TaxID=92402 RepID=UPI003594918E
MKKSKKILLAFAAISPLFVLPLASVSCKDPKGPKVNNNVEMQSHLDIKIAKVAKNQESVDPEEVVKKFLDAKNWDEVKELFKKYNIAFEVSTEAPKGAEYAVAKSTHAHADEGIIHLDITRTVNGKSETKRFEVGGFKKEVIEAKYTFGNYELTTKSKKQITPYELKVKIIEAQNKGFEELIKVLAEFVEVKKIKEDDKESQFSFDEKSIEEVKDSGQLHFEKVYLYQKSKPEAKTEAKSHFVITDLKKE